MRAKDSLLVTGGAGFVGSHFVRAAHDAGSRVVVVDDLSGGTPQPLPPGVELVRGDVADRSLIARLVHERDITAMAHFAGKICVGESVEQPARYFEANLVRTLALLDVVLAEGPATFVFSSTAAVYGLPQVVPVDERAPRDPLSPYGMSKLAIEHALEAYGDAHGLRWAALRYFNAAGGHPDGTLAEVRRCGRRDEPWQRARRLGARGARRHRSRAW